MNCRQCGAGLLEGARFCSVCGAEVIPGTASGYIPQPGYRPALLRPRYGRKVAGVCAALARYYGMDVMLLRILALILLLGFGTGFLAYVIAWIVIPEEPYSLPVGA